jgi:hypothetical protein
VWRRKAKNVTRPPPASGHCTLSVANRRRGGAGCMVINGHQWSLMVGVHGHTAGRRAAGECRVRAATRRAALSLSLSRAGFDQAPHRIHRRRVCTRAAVGGALCGAVWSPQSGSAISLRSGGRCRCTRRSRSARRPTCGCRSRTPRREGSAASCALASWAAARAFQSSRC